MPKFSGPAGALPPTQGDERRTSITELELGSGSPMLAMGLGQEAYATQEWRLIQNGLDQPQVKNAFSIAFQVATSHGKPLQGGYLTQELFMKFCWDLRIMPKSQVAAELLSKMPLKQGIRETATLTPKAVAEIFQSVAINSTLEFNRFVQAVYHLRYKMDPFPFDVSSVSAALQLFAKEYLQPYIDSNVQRSYTPECLHLKIIDEMFWESQRVLLKIYETYCDPYTRKISIGSVVQFCKHFTLSPPLTKERVQVLCDALDIPPVSEDNEVTKLAFPDFLEFLLRASFEHMPPINPVAADPYPTVGSKLYTLLRHLRQTFATLFREAPVPLTSEKQHYPIAETLWVDQYPSGYISTQAMKELQSAVPADRSMQIAKKVRTEAYVAPAGTSLTIQGRHFSKDHGLYIKFGDVTVHGRVSSAASAHVEVPTQLCDRLLLETKDIPDEMGHPVHTAILSVVRSVPVAVSTFRMTWSPAPTFTYQSPQHLFPIHERFYAQLHQIFTWYCDQRDGGGHAELLYLEEWQQFKEDFNVREPNPDSVALSAEGAADRPSQPPCNATDEGLVQHDGTVSHDEMPTDHSTLFPLFATCRPGSKEPHTPALGFQDFLRIVLLSQLPHSTAALLLQAVPQPTLASERGSLANLKSVHSPRTESPRAGSQSPQGSPSWGPHRGLTMVDPVEKLEVHIRMNCWELPSVNAPSPHEAAVSDSDRAAAEKLSNIEKIEKALQQRRKRPTVVLTDFEGRDCAEPSPVRQVFQRQWQHWADPELLRNFKGGRGDCWVSQANHSQLLELYVKELSHLTAMLQRLDPQAGATGTLEGDAIQRPPMPELEQKERMLMADQLLVAKDERIQTVMNREHLQAYRLRKIIDELLQKQQVQEESLEKMQSKHDQMYKCLVQMQRYVQLEQETTDKLQEYAPEPPPATSKKEQERAALYSMNLQGRAVYRNWIAALMDSLYEALGKVPCVDPLGGKKKPGFAVQDVLRANEPHGKDGLPLTVDTVQQQVEQRIEKRISRYQESSKRQQEAESTADRLAWRMMNHHRQLAEKDNILRDLERQLDEVMNRKQQTDGNLQVASHLMEKKYEYVQKKRDKYFAEQMDAMGEELRARELELDEGTREKEAAERRILDLEEQMRKAQEAARQDKEDALVAARAAAQRRTAEVLATANVEMHTQLQELRDELAQANMCIAETASRRPSATPMMRSASRMRRPVASTFVARSHSRRGSLSRSRRSSLSQPSSASRSRRGSVSRRSSVSQSPQADPQAELLDRVRSDVQRLANVQSPTPEVPQPSTISDSALRLHHSVAQSEVSSVGPDQRSHTSDRPSDPEASARSLSPLDAEVPSDDHLEDKPPTPSDATQLFSSLSEGAKGGRRKSVKSLIQETIAERKAHLEAVAAQSGATSSRRKSTSRRSPSVAGPQSKAGSRARRKRSGSSGAGAATASDDRDAFLLPGGPPPPPPSDAAASGTASEEAGSPPQPPTEGQPHGAPPAPEPSSPLPQSLGSDPPPQSASADPPPPSSQAQGPEAVPLQRPMGDSQAVVVPGFESRGPATAQSCGTAEGLASPAPGAAEQGQPDGAVPRLTSSAEPSGASEDGNAPPNAAAEGASVDGATEEGACAPDDGPPAPPDPDAAPVALGFEDRRAEAADARPPEEAAAGGPSGVDGVTVPAPAGPETPRPSPSSAGAETRPGAAPQPPGPAAAGPGRSVAQQRRPSWSECAGDWQPVETGIADSETSGPRQDSAPQPEDAQSLVTTGSDDDSSQSLASLGSFRTTTAPQAPQGPPGPDAARTAPSGGGGGAQAPDQLRRWDTLPSPDPPPPGPSPHPKGHRPGVPGQLCHQGSLALALAGMNASVSDEELRALALQGTGCGTAPALHDAAHATRARPGDVREQAGASEGPGDVDAAGPHDSDLSIVKALSGDASFHWHQTSGDNASDDVGTGSASLESAAPQPGHVVTRTAQGDGAASGPPGSAAANASQAPSEESQDADDADAVSARARGAAMNGALKAQNAAAKRRGRSIPGAGLSAPAQRPLAPHPDPNVALQPEARKLSGAQPLPLKGPKNKYAPSADPGGRVSPPNWASGAVVWADGAPAPAARRGSGAGAAEPRAPPAMPPPPQTDAPGPAVVVGPVAGPHGSGRATQSKEPGPARTALAISAVPPPGGLTVPGAPAPGDDLLISPRNGLTLALVPPTPKAGGAPPELPESSPQAPSQSPPAPHSPPAPRALPQEAPPEAPPQPHAQEHPPGPAIESPGGTAPSLSAEQLQERLGGRFAFPSLVAALNREAAGGQTTPAPEPRVADPAPEPGRAARARPPDLALQGTHVAGAQPLAELRPARAAKREAAPGDPGRGVDGSALASTVQELQRMGVSLGDVGGVVGQGSAGGDDLLAKLLELSKAMVEEAVPGVLHSPRWRSERSGSIGADAEDGDAEDYAVGLLRSFVLLHRHHQSQIKALHDKSLKSARPRAHSVSLNEFMITPLTPHSTAPVPQHKGPRALQRVRSQTAALQAAFGDHLPSLRLYSGPLHTQMAHLLRDQLQQLQSLAAHAALTASPVASPRSARGHVPPHAQRKSVQRLPRPRAPGPRSDAGGAGAPQWTPAARSPPLPGPVTAPVAAALPAALLPPLGSAFHTSLSPHALL